MKPLKWENVFVGKLNLRGYPTIYRSNGLRCLVSPFHTIGINFDYRQKGKRNFILHFSLLWHDFWTLGDYTLIWPPQNLALIDKGECDLYWDVSFFHNEVIELRSLLEIEAHLQPFIEKHASVLGPLEYYEEQLHIETSNVYWNAALCALAANDKTQLIKYLRALPNPAEFKVLSQFDVEKHLMPLLENASDEAIYASRFALRDYCQANWNSLTRPRDKFARLTCE